MNKLESLENLIDSFAKLPGVGKKTAERLAYAVLNMREEDVQEFSKALLHVKSKIHPCPHCGMLTEKELCDICSSLDLRDKTKLIVTTTSRDALAIEASFAEYPYHVLNGNISLLKNIKPENINIASLLDRIEKENIKEVILATNPTIEGETTARYIASLLENKDIIVSRLAVGMPMGGELDYQDSLTIKKALNGRINIK
ncbi:MAG: recombination mediator RecR [Bacilli bacterium]